MNFGKVSFLFYHKNITYHKIKLKEGETMPTQESVKEKLIEKCRGLKINYIAEQTGIPREIVSAFKNGRRQLWESSLIKLDAFLDKY